MKTAFDTGFGRDGMAALPWLQGHHIVCPGSLIAKNRSSHRCRFVSVDDTRLEDFELAWRINAQGLLVASQQVLADMRSAGGGSMFAAARM